MRSRLVAIASIVSATAVACVAREGARPRPLPDAQDQGATDFQPLAPELVEELVAEAEQVRELELIEPFEAVAVTSDQIRLHIRQQIEGIEMATAERILRAFGFTPEPVDLGELLTELLGSEVIGLYDPHTERLMVLGSIADSLGSESLAALEARAVLIHEITHVLQDQHFDTLDHTSDEAWTDDAGTVWSCLAEGDATLSMLVAMFRGVGLPIDATLQPGFREQAEQFAQAALPSSPALGQAPPYFGHVLAATYFDGLTFAADLRRLGGWDAVDEAHRSPPRSTRDVLHPALYLEGRRLFEIDLPDVFTGLPLETHRLVHEATLGELETGAFLLPLHDAERLRDAAAGWAGDRFAVFESAPDRLTLIWRLRFEGAEDAAEFFEAAIDAQVAAGRGPCTGQWQRRDVAPDATRFTVCNQGADRLSQLGADVAIVRGADPEHAEGLSAALLAAPAVERSFTPPQLRLMDRITELAPP
jgi:hypothetical protein